MSTMVEARGRDMAPIPSGGAVSKVDKFRWTLRDEPGVFLSIPKVQLQIPREYQRHELKRKSIAIARDWSWAACGALIVAERGNGQYYVVDGQHRKLAADMRTDIKELPCLVFTLCGVPEEAVAFLGANTNRNPLKSAAKFNAKIVAGDPVAEAINEFARMANRKISPVSNENTLSCVSSMEMAYRNSPDALRMIWPILIDICRGKIINKDLLSGLVYIERNAPDGASLADKYWRNRLLTVGYDDLMLSIRRYRQLHGRLGEKMNAGGILVAIHKGIRRRFPGSENVA